jgi:hypothetical protein
MSGRARACREWMADKHDVLLIPVLSLFGDYGWLRACAVKQQRSVHKTRMSHCLLEVVRHIVLIAKLPG